MNLDDIVQQLKQERSRLDAVIQALEGTNRRGRPRGSAKRHTMSVAARKKISAMMKKHWAERRKKSQK